MTIETHYKDQNSVFGTNNSRKIESRTKIKKTDVSLVPSSNNNLLVADGKYFLLYSLIYTIKMNVFMDVY